jgi:23S rRNA (uracil1939-C5)-methyltransferase
VAVGGEALVAIEECFLPMDALNALWPQLDLEPLPELGRIGLRQGTDEQLLLVLESESDEAFDLKIEASIAAVQIGPESTHILSDDFQLEMEVNQRRFRVSAPSFFQVNTAMAGKMVDHLLEHLNLSADMTVLDVYCGVGLFSAFIAPHVGQLVGVEASPTASEDFAINLDEFEHVSIYEASAEDALPSLEISPDVVLVDPPRAGLDAGVLDAIAGLDPATIVYVSCDPATLARDGKRLVEKGYRLERITPFDLFPQTYHIETVSFWEK